MKLAALFGAPAPREKLREARRNLASADAALTKAEADSARVRELARVADRAEATEKSARAAADEGLQRWAAEGALGSPPEDVQRLIDAATTLRELAGRARLVADGAKKALSGSGQTPAERRAIEARQEAEFAVKCAAGEVVLADGASALNRALAARAALDAELPDVLAIYLTLRNLNVSSRFSTGGPAAWLEDLKRLVAPPKEATILANFLAGRFHGVTPEQQPWIALGNSLVDDADAKP